MVGGGAETTKYRSYVVVHIGFGQNGDWIPTMGAWSVGLLGVVREPSI